MANFQPPPTFADVILFELDGSRPKFNPIWLKWFLDVAELLPGGNAVLGTVTSVGLTAPAAGITVSGSPITTSGSMTLALAGDLAALEALSSTGLARRTGAAAWSAGTTVATDEIADDAVTYAKIQNVSATDRLLGRSAVGAGDTEEIVCTAAGRAILDDTTAAAQRLTLGFGADTAWTPADVSGAGLALTVTGAQYVDFGGIIIASADVTYPVTADVSAAAIGGLPATIKNSAGWRSGLIIATTNEATLFGGLLVNNGTSFDLRTSADANITNAVMSGNRVAFMCIYLKA